MPEWRVNHEFVETTCRVLGKQIGEKDFGEDGLLYRPEIKIRYEVGGVEYQDPHYDISYYDSREGYSGGREDAQAILDRFELYSANAQDLSLLVRSGQSRRRRAGARLRLGECGWSLPCRFPSSSSAPAV